MTLAEYQTEENEQFIADLRADAESKRRLADSSMKKSIAAENEYFTALENYDRSTFEKPGYRNILKERKLAAYKAYKLAVMWAEQFDDEAYQAEEKYKKYD